MPKNIRKKTGKKSDTTPDAPSLESLPSMQSMESLLANIGNKGRSKRSAVDAAQEIMYDAWDAETSKRRVSLARKALTISADCADAYVLLAQETARSLDEAIELYRKGVEAGERALGKETFRDEVGFFWGMLETRPYMRARSGLAQCLWDAGEQKEAVEHYIDMLRLNPNDNQGIRHPLMPCLIELGRDKDAEKLFEEFKEGGDATWMYSRALLDFRKHGGSPVAEKSLKAAIEENKHVPAYLLGRKKMPRQLPAYVGFGDENEAVTYVYGNQMAWKASPGSLEWFATQMK